MEKLHALIKNGEDWLLERSVDYARERGYLKHTATSKDSWRAAIIGLSQSVLAAIQRSDKPAEFGPEDNPEQDPVLSFGMEEARRHRSRGVTIGMFLGLIKYFRQSYIDLVYESKLARPQKDRYRKIVDRIFDRIEIGFCMEWGDSPEKKLREELQQRNRILTAEKNRYQTLIESIPDPVVLLDENFVVDKANPPAVKLFKLICPTDQEPSNGLIGKLIDDVAKMLPDQKEEITFARDVETLCGTRHFNIQVKRMQDISEKYQGVVMVFVDLTERKRVEDELRLFRDLIDQSSDSLMIVEPEEGNFLYVNETVCHRLGYSREELYTMQTPQIEADPNHAQTRKILLRRLRDQGTWSVEEYHRRKDGTEFPVEVNMKYVRQDNRDYIIAATREITERRELEKKFSEQLVFMQTLLDSIPFPVYYKDLTFRYIGCNTAFEKFLGIPRNNIVGKTVLEVLPAESAAICHQADLMVFQEQKTWTYTCPLEPARTLMFHKTPFFRPDGTMGGLVGVAWDITEKKQEDHAMDLVGVEQNN